MKSKSSTILSVDQIKEIISGNVSAETRLAEVEYFLSELKRREKAGKLGGRPKTSPLSRAEQNREKSARYREKQKASQSKNGDNPVL